MTRESLELTRERVGERLDRAIVSTLHEVGREVSRSQLARAFAAGQVWVEGKPAKPSSLVVGAGVIEFELRSAEPLARANPEAITLVIVHEDDDVLVIDKPAGMVVHAGPGHDAGTVVNAVLHHLGANAKLPVLAGNGPERPGIVHRLDRDTSGLLVVAKHALALDRLARQFRDHSIDRSYLGIVAGSPDFETRRVETLHGRDPGERRRFSPDHGERRAITKLVVESRFGDRAALVRFELETGRTHQIRMHARMLGIPIFGDSLYGFRVRDPQLHALADRLGRHALHAGELGFEHPRGGRLQLHSPLPPELAALADRLRP